MRKQQFVEEKSISMKTAVIVVVTELVLLVTALLFTPFAWEIQKDNLAIVKLHDYDVIPWKQTSTKFLNASFDIRKGSIIEYSNYPYEKYSENVSVTKAFTNASHGEYPVFVWRLYSDQESLEIDYRLAVPDSQSVDSLPEIRVLGNSVKVFKKFQLVPNSRTSPVVVACSSLDKRSVSVEKRMTEISVVLTIPETLVDYKLSVTLKAQLIRFQFKSNFKTISSTTPVKVIARENSTVYMIFKHDENFKPSSDIDSYQIVTVKMEYEWLWTFLSYFHIVPLTIVISSFGFFLVLAAFAFYAILCSSKKKNQYCKIKQMETQSNAYQIV